MNKKTENNIIFCLSLLVLFSCELPTAPESTPSVAGAEKIRVGIALGTPGNGILMSVMPGLPELAEITKFELWGAQSGAETKIAGFETIESANVWLDAGTWNFTLKTFIDDSQVLEGAITGIDIASSGANELVFHLSPLSNGTGRVRIEIQLPAGSGVTDVETFIDGTVLTPALPIVNDTIVYENNALDSGQYLFSFRLNNSSGSMAAVVSEIVKVYDNLRSEKTIALNISDLNTPPAAPINLRLSLVDANNFVLEWDDSSYNETGFVLNNGSEDYNYDSCVTTSTQFSVTGNIGKTYQVKAFNDFGESPWSSPLVAAVTFTGTVTISGEPIKGERLMATVGVLSRSGVKNYQWLRDDIPIPRANNFDYFLSASDYGKIIKVQVSLSGYSGSISSEPIGPIDGTFTVGEYGQGGGTVIYINRDNTYGDWAYLEGVTESLPDYAVWGFYGIDVAGAAGTAIGTGKANTQAMIDAGAPEGSAARLCVEYRGGGYDDWFLPSKDESEYMRGLPSGTSFPLWSSSQDDSLESWGYRKSGDELISSLQPKYSVSAVRPVRTFGASSDAPPPVLTGTVTINGTAIRGATLAAVTTSLYGDSDISYQWIRDASTPILGATSPIYTLVTEDVGHTIKVQVSRSGYSGTVSSTPTDTVIIPALTGTVAVSGNANYGDTLTAVTTNLNGTGAIFYQWIRDDSTTILDAVNSMYTTVSSDVGHTLKVQISRPGYSGTITSEPSARITYPALTGTVIINGPANYGATLTAVTSISGNVSYQWFVTQGGISTSPISGATGKTYTISDSTFIGCTIEVRVSRSGYAGTINSGLTDSIQNVLATPTVSMKLYGLNKILVSWYEVNGANRYDIYRSATSSLSPTGWSRIAQNVSGTSYVDTTPQSQTMYYYRVVACTVASDNITRTAESFRSSVTPKNVATFTHDIGGIHNNSIGIYHYVRTDKASGIGGTLLRRGSGPHLLPPGGYVEKFNYNDTDYHIYMNVNDNGTIEFFD
jgi:hypothetical protein